MLWLGGGNSFGIFIDYVYSLLALINVFPAVKQNTAMQLPNNVLTFLGLIGAIVDRTTAKLEDSDRAMGYQEPWNDNRE
ncbi:phage holin [Aristaeella lactis]|uniref:Holin, phage phi LC3 family n=1 Tax=Aristaeella lactis TaxID=3046383 RepID=A0AC61PL50_9FIRM|nr:phage holin [Aristaeella lactis]QUA52176.1 hypothetical protein JYE50_10665 [Aristaeella lactis]SMC58431.1 holin, phage phi LC3 family [Aristaeella lactis]